MSIQLQNQFIQLGFSTKGAELQYLKHKTNGFNYLWEANPAVWGKYSPILFPIVGALKDNCFFYNGNTYQLPRHGFARDRMFEITKHTDNQIDFLLKSDENTLKMYPFQFELKLTYLIENHTLQCIYQVVNPSNEDLLFSIGAHPAFAVPLANIGSYNDYYLEFEDQNNLESYLIENNLLTSKTTQIPLINHQLLLHQSLFDSDALVFKHLETKKVSLKNKLNQHGLDFCFDGFDYFGIWAAPNGNFVCLEPWCGIADNEKHSKNFELKEGVQRLKPQQTWMRTWQVTLY